MKDVLAERKQAEQARAKTGHRHTESKRAAQAPPPSDVSSPAPTVEQANKLCREYSFWREEMQGVRRF
jgi:hypothetical protein